MRIVLIAQIKNVALNKALAGKVIMLALTCHICTGAGAQTFNGNLTITTQTQADAFNFTAVTGDLSIGNSLSDPINELDGLFELTSVGGNLSITSTSLGNINGLTNLISIGGNLMISGSNSLLNLDPLASLANFDGSLTITNNATLTNINGLAGFATQLESLLIEGNSLLNLDGLASVTTITGNAKIEESGLININGLSNLTSVNGDFWVPNAPTEPLSALTTIGGNLRIHDFAYSTIDGLASLNSLTGFLSIDNSFGLKNIDGLLGLTSLGGLIITGNHDLQNLYGLSNVTSITATVYILSNSGLTNLDGLSGLTSLTADLGIEGNASLTQFCGLYPLFSGGGLTGNFIFMDNGANPTAQDIINGGACTFTGYYGDILISSQAEADAFNFTEVTGMLTIYGANITSLAGLSELTMVGGSLTIHDNILLANLNGLSALTSVNDLVITSNDILADITGLSNLTSSGGINISGNPALEDLNGLSGITETVAVIIEGNTLLSTLNGLAIVSIEGILIVRSNPALVNIDALSTLIFIGLPPVEFSLRIVDNPLLTDLDGLSNLAIVEGNLQIASNSNLGSFCGLYKLLSEDGLGGTYTVTGNALNPTMQQIIDGGECSVLAVPTVTINQAAGQADPTNASPINFTVVFNEPITGFTADDVILSGTAGATTVVITEIAPNNGTTFNIAVGGMTSDGTVIATIPAGGVVNTANVTNLASSSTDNTVTFSLPDTAPTIICPGSITVDSGLGTCGGVVEFSGENAITFTGSPSPIFSWLIFEPGGGGGGAVHQNAPPASMNLPVGVSTVTFTATNDAGLASCTITITVVDIEPPVFTYCPDDVTVNVDPGICKATVRYFVAGDENCVFEGPQSVIVTAPNGINHVFNGSLEVFAGTYNDEFPIGTTPVRIVATDAAGNTATCSFTVTVIDNEIPVITSKPPDVTVECASQVPAINIASVTATDNCGSPTITHVNDVTSNQTCTNRYTVTRTYRATDESGNTATAIQLITVDDQTPPTITGLAPSKRVLAPPNHKMVDITLDYTVSDNCVNTSNVTISVTSNEPVNGTGDGDTDPDWEVIDGQHIRLRAERAAHGTGRIYTVTVTVSDGCNAPVSGYTEVVVAHNITKPHSGNSFKAGSTVALSGEFWDVPGNKHSAKWLIDGNSAAKASVTEPSGNKNGAVNGSYKFSSPGVYKLQMNITDQHGVTTYANTNGDVDAIVVIYDPNGGHTYGGGYYDSPAGALVSNPSSTGKASYGFALNYFKNSTYPKGETQFEFKVGDFEFNALNFDYLVISNSMAQFKGTGKIIGGQSGIGFTMTVVDGQLDGTGVDKIRMKIYNKNNGTIIYDNQPGASDAALPTAAVGANSVIVIQGSSGNAPTTKTTSQQIDAESRTLNGLELDVYPNPASNYFNIVVRSNNTNEKIVLQVFDQYGRLVEAKTNVSDDSIVRLGDSYTTGVYYIRAVQGKQHKELKLIKLAD